MVIKLQRHLWKLSSSPVNIQPRHAIRRQWNRCKCVWRYHSSSRTLHGCAQLGVFSLLWKSQTPAGQKGEEPLWWRLAACGHSKGGATESIYHQSMVPLSVLLARIILGWILQRFHLQQDYQRRGLCLLRNGVDTFRKLIQQIQRAMERWWPRGMDQCLLRR